MYGLMPSSTYSPKITVVTVETATTVGNSVDKR